MLPNEDFSSLEEKIGYEFQDKKLLLQALTHSSFSNEQKINKHPNYERLEFLGDAILDAIVGDIVYKRFEGKREGFLTNTRSKIVQRETLNKLAVEIGLDKLINELCCLDYAHAPTVYNISSQV